MTRNEFVFIMESIKEQMDLNREIEDKMNSVFYDFVGIVKTPLVDKTIEFLTNLMKDKNGNIEYFIFDLDFGRDSDMYKDGSPIKEKDGEDIPFKTTEDVFDYITTLQDPYIEIFKDILKHEKKGCHADGNYCSGCPANNVCGLDNELSEFAEAYLKVNG